MRFTYNQFDDSPLDDIPLNITSDDDEEEDFDVNLTVATEPSPFSQKRNLFSTPGKVK